jgi:hypothetical protein
VCVAFDPTNASVAYIGFGGFFNGAFANNQHIYKTTNFDTTGATTWTAVGNGMPDTPINAIMVDYLIAASSLSLNSKATGDFFYSTTAANGIVTTASIPRKHTQRLMSPRRLRNAKQLA